MKFTVRKIITYYAHIEADTEAEALAQAEESNIIDLDADSVEDDWEVE